MTADILQFPDDIVRQWEGLAYVAQFAPDTRDVELAIANVIGGPSPIPSAVLLSAWSAFRKAWQNYNAAADDLRDALDPSIDLRERFLDDACQLGVDVDSVRESETRKAERDVETARIQMHYAVRRAITQRTSR